MRQDNITLIEAIKRIATARNCKSLALNLVPTLSLLIKADAIIFLRLLRGDDAFEVAAESPENCKQSRLDIIKHASGYPCVKSDSGMMDCWARREVMSEETSGEISGEIRHLFPIDINNKFIGMLAIYGSIEVGCLQDFLYVYCNFMAVLDDNEHDTLTGLLNRKTFDLHIDALITDAGIKEAISFDEGTERRKESDAKIDWLCILDIDYFKRVNDQFGHIVGDEVLLLFSQKMKLAFRNNDMLFRYGGEEFIVVMAPTNEVDAMKVVERFRQQLALFEFPQIGRVTVSVGMVSIGSQEPASTVLELADQALYYAKEHGRNKVCNYHRLIEAGLLEERNYAGAIELF